MNNRTKVVLAGMTGNALEFYDFTLYGFFASLIARSFFPYSDENSFTALLLALTIYAVGFLMRPLGAIVFGHIGDKYGRKKALSLSVMLMAIPTTLIGFLPDYATIGILAPIILTLCRLMQGLCTGGAYNGAAIFVIEHQKERRGFAGGLITSSCAIGALLGAFVGYVCTLQDHIFGFESWRLPFILGMVIGFVGAYIRRQLDESPVFVEAMAKQAAQEKNKPVDKVPLFDALAKHWRSVVCIMGMAWLNGVMYYAAFNYMSIYLREEHNWAVHDTLPMSSVALVVYALLTPFAGSLADRRGPVGLMRPAAIAVLFLAVPVFMMISTGQVWMIVTAQVIYAMLAAFFSGPLNFFMQSLFPVEDRYSGISFSYSLGMAIFGGSTLLIMETLRVHVDYAFSPALWLTVSAFAASMVLTFLYPKIKKSAQ